MKSQIKKIIGNTSSIVMANVFVTIVSIVTNLIAPKILGIEDYGYWQMYILYLGYVGFVQLGWTEGVYLKIGGKKITDLEGQFIDVQVKLLTLFQVISTVFFFIIIHISNLSEKWIYMAVILMILPTNIRQFCSCILMATNEIKSYAKVLVIDRALFVIGFIYCIAFHNCSVCSILVADCLARILSGVYSLRKITPTFYHRYKCKKEIILDVWNSVSCGSKLLIANLASTLIIGIVKMVVGWRWDISIFSQVSLAISITHMVVILINAIGIAMFPILRAITTEQLIKTYQQLRAVLTFLMVVCLIFYFPIRGILIFWLPDYGSSLEYVGMIFPMIIYETRNAMLLNTYYKALRLEKSLLMGNMLCLIFSFLTSIISAYILNSVNIAIISIFVVLVFRCILLETWLGKTMGINENRNNLAEFIISVVFIVCTFYFEVSIGSLIYCIALIGYSIINFSIIKNIVNFILTAK